MDAVNPSDWDYLFDYVGHCDHIHLVNLFINLHDLGNEQGTDKDVRHPQIDTILETMIRSSHPDQVQLGHMCLLMYQDYFPHTYQFFANTSSMGICLLGGN